MNHLHPTLLAATVALAVTFALPAFASLASDTFKDVPNGHWAENGVAEVAIKHDLMKGYPDGTFRGNTPFTREQFADSLANLLRDLEATSKISWRPSTHPINDYADVKPGDERDEILTLANDYGLFEGIPGITPDAFGPDRTVSRNDMAKVLDNLMHLAEAKDVVRPSARQGEVPHFKDLDSNSWAYQAVVDDSQRYGVMVGFPDGTFRGDEQLTRYQYAQAISQTVPLIHALIAQTVVVKKEEKLATEGPHRLQDEELLRLSLSYGVTGGNSLNPPSPVNGTSIPSVGLRLVGYPNGWFWLSDTRLQLQSGALAGLGTTPTSGTALNENLVTMVQVPMLGPVQVQPFVGLDSYLDLAANGETYGFLGPNIGLVGHYRPGGSPWGVFLKGGLSDLLLGTQLAGPAGRPNPNGLLTLNSELGAEYFVQHNQAVTVGFSYYETPAGYLSTIPGAPALGKATFSGLTLGYEF